MNENEASERIKYRMHAVEQVAGENGMEDLEMAIKALEEIQRWHTSVVNPNVKNEFANRSTQICVNCDHKDEYIEELEAEVEEYRAIGTVEECRVAVEKQTAKRPRIMGNAMICPSCPRCFKSDNSAYCPSCGQRIDWGE